MTRTTIEKQKEKVTTQFGICFCLRWEADVLSTSRDKQISPKTNWTYSYRLILLYIILYPYPLPFEWINIKDPSVKTFAIGIYPSNILVHHIIYFNLHKCNARVPHSEVGRSQNLGGAGSIWQKNMITILFSILVNVDIEFVSKSLLLHSTVQTYLEAV